MFFGSRQKKVLFWKSLASKEKKSKFENKGFALGKLKKKSNRVSVKSWENSKFFLVFRHKIAKVNNYSSFN